MLAGKRAFERSTSAQTMTAILQDDPPAISQVVKAAPQGLQRVVQRCLEKSPEQRFHSSSDLAFALEALSDSGSSPAVALARSSRPRWLGLVAAGALAAAAAFVVAWWRTPEPVPVVESITQLTEDSQLKTNLFTDGSRIYFNEGPQRGRTIAQVSVTGGPVAPLETRLPNPTLFGATRDGSTLLVNSTPIGDLFCFRSRRANPVVSAYRGRMRSTCFRMAGSFSPMETTSSPRPKMALTTASLFLFLVLFAMWKLPRMVSGCSF